MQPFMKKVAFLLLAGVLAWSGSFAQTISGQPAFPKCGSRARHNIVPNVDTGFWAVNTPGNHSVLAYQPGDTIVFYPANEMGNYWTYFNMEGFKGNPACPLVITNAGGQVNFRQGMTISNSTYVKVTGSGAKGMQYGLLFTGKDPGRRGQGPFAVTITDRSKGIEVERVSIHNVGMGFNVKNEGGCADSLNYPNWVIDSISIHDNRIVGIWNEGMYIGNTSPDNAADSYDPRPVDCNGVKFYPKPFRVGNIRIYNNYVDSTGRGGIQIASASTGMSEISHNIIRHNGLNGDDAQGTGISAGAYAHVNIHDNTVCNTYTWGIASLGGSGTGTVLRIENNRIDSSGYLVHYDLANTEKEMIDPGTEPVFPDNLKWPYAIELGTRPTLFKDSTTFSITNNVIGLYKSRVAAIQVSDGHDGITRSGNIICGNTTAGGGTPATLYVDQSKRRIHYSENCGPGKAPQLPARTTGRLRLMVIAGMLGAASAGIWLMYRAYRRRSATKTA